MKYYLNKETDMKHLMFRVTRTFFFRLLRPNGQFMTNSVNNDSCNTKYQIQTHKLIDLNFKIYFV